MQKNHPIAIPLTTFDGEPRIDSRVVADWLGIERESLFRLFNHYRADFQRFGVCRAELGEVRGRRGPEKYALLNLDQALRLLTYFDDLPKTEPAQARLLHAFSGAMPAPFQVEPADEAATHILRSRSENGGLIPFSFEAREIRFIPVGDSFSVVAKDVLRALDYSDEYNPARAIAHVPDEWRGVHRMHTLGGLQEMLTLTEQGFYFFVNRSDKPKALPLQKWVAGEVLPSIRKTGGYALPGVQPGLVPAALRSSINRHAWALASQAAQESFEAYRAEMLTEAARNPDFSPEHWQPEPAKAAALVDPAWQIANQSSYRTRNPKRDTEVLRLRLTGMSYREIGEKMGISGTHAWRIVSRQASGHTMH